MPTNKEKNFISAVVYMHDNQATIVPFVDSLNRTLADNFDRYEIIIVNDCSADRSVELVKQYAKEHEAGAISILNMGYPQGVEQSMNAGIDLAIGDFVFQFDSAVCQWQWDMLMDVYRRSLQGFDIVCAVNECHRRSQPLFYRLFNRYADVQHPVTDYAFMLITRRGINRVGSLTKVVPYRNALYANCGLAMENMTYCHTAGAGVPSGRRSYSNLILFTDLGYRIARNLTFVMALIVLLIFIYAVVIFFFGHPVEGWTTTMLLMSTSFFGIFAVLAVVLKYLSVITGLIFKKQHYIFSSIEKLVNQ